MFEVGDRVQLTQDVERYPHFIAPAGLTGIVVSLTEVQMSVRLDAPLAGAEAWDNEVHWYDLDHDLGDDPAEDLRKVAV